MRPFEIIFYLSCYYNTQTAQQVCINQAIKFELSKTYETKLTLLNLALPSLICLEKDALFHAWPKRL